MYLTDIYFTNGAAGISCCGFQAELKCKIWSPHANNFVQNLVKNYGFYQAGVSDYEEHTKMCVKHKCNLSSVKKMDSVIKDHPGLYLSRLTWKIVWQAWIILIKCIT